MVETTSRAGRSSIGSGTMSAPTFRPSNLLGQAPAWSSLVGLSFDLLDEWYAPGDGIDVFVVLNIIGRGGATPDKDPEGLAIEVTGAMITGYFLAHELGHYLGIDYHADSKKSLMYEKLGKPPYWLNSSMVQEMKSNDAIHGGCP